MTRSPEQYAPDESARQILRLAKDIVRSNPNSASLVSELVSSTLELCRKGNLLSSQLTSALVDDWHSFLFAAGLATPLQKSAQGSVTARVIDPSSHSDDPEVGKPKV